MCGRMYMNDFLEEKELDSGIESHEKKDDQRVVRGKAFAGRPVTVGTKEMSQEEYIKESNDRVRPTALAAGATEAQPLFEAETKEPSRFLLKEAAWHRFAIALKARGTQAPMPPSCVAAAYYHIAVQH